MNDVMKCIEENQFESVKLGLKIKELRNKESLTQIALSEKTSL